MRCTLRKLKATYIYSRNACAKLYLCRIDMSDPWKKVRGWISEGERVLARTSGRQSPCSFLGTAHHLAVLN